MIRQPYVALMKPKNAQGEVREPNFARAAERIARYEIPGDNLFYTRLAYERLFVDQLAAMGDRNPGDSYRRMERRARDEGTRFFAPPGAGLSQARSPDWSNALGGNDAPSP